MSNCLSTGENCDRRDFLRAMSAAALATLGTGVPRSAQAAEPVRHPTPTADTCILLWMAGGMAAPETFDPKRYTPFKVGEPSEKILCTFPAITIPATFSLLKSRIIRPSWATRAQ